MVADQALTQKNDHLLGLQYKYWNKYYVLIFYFVKTLKTFLERSGFTLK